MIRIGSPANLMLQSPCQLGRSPHSRHEQLRPWIATADPLSGRLRCRGWSKKMLKMARKSCSF